MAPRIIYQNLHKSIELTTGEISENFNISSVEKSFKTKGTVQVQTYAPKDKEVLRNLITEKLVDLKDPHCIWAFNGRKKNRLCRLNKKLILVHTFNFRYELCSEKIEFKILLRNKNV